MSERHGGLGKRNGSAFMPSSSSDYSVLGPGNPAEGKLRRLARLFNSRTWPETLVRQLDRTSVDPLDLREAQAIANSVLGDSVEKLPIDGEQPEETF
jgi:hypothetical protein